MSFFEEDNFEINIYKLYISYILVVFILIKIYAHTRYFKIKNSYILSIFLIQYKVILNKIYWIYCRINIVYSLIRINVPLGRLHIPIFKGKNLELQI